MKQLPSLAEDIEAEFGDARRGPLESLFTKQQLAALEVALEASASGMPRAAKVLMKGRALDDLLLRVGRAQLATGKERFALAKSIIGEHIAAQRPAASGADDDGVAEVGGMEGWLRKEEMILAKVRRGCGMGDLEPQHLKGRTNVEVMRAMMEGQVPFPVIARTLSFCIVEIDHGRAVLQCPPSADFVNPMQTVHGGWITTLLDTAMGTAVFSGLPPGHGYTTMNINVNFLEGLTLKTERVRAAGTIVEPIGRSTKVRAWLYGADDKVYAEAQGRFRTIPMPA